MHANNTGLHAAPHSSTQHCPCVVSCGAGNCRWQDGDIGSWSVISYPDKLQDYILREFARIKMQQARLLGFKPPKPPPIASKL